MRFQELGWAVLSAASVLGCADWQTFVDDLIAAGNGSDGDGQGGGGSAPQPPQPDPSRGPKLDLLFMIDNSISMSDKQQLLSRALPDFLARLTETSLTDLHVGIVSSSLGDAGANVACPAQPNHPKFRPDQVDMAHLVGSLERSSTPGNAHGFLEWRAGATDGEALEADLASMVSAVGEGGCGWEASLESWYRFLVDPAPYRELTRVACAGSTSGALNCVQPATDAQGNLLSDETLLAQRQAFLRDDSLLGIVMLTDENDCSMQVGNQSWVVLNIEDTRPMFRSSSVCAENPNDQCCYSCPLQPPAGCAADPVCEVDVRLRPEQDGQNLRCFEQKRRFGVDFLYPTARYVNALTQPELCWSALDLDAEGCEPSELYDNPLFSGGRSPEQVFLTGILGVPWQALASDESDGEELRLRSFAQLTSDGVWAEILGSPGLPYAAATASTPERPGTAPVPPRLAQMVESPALRPGVGEGNPINGRDYDTAQGTATQTGSVPRADDLQYACIFPLPEPRDCAQLDPNTDNCDCYDGVNDRPLCEQTPGVSQPGTTQHWGKAYPGLRQLEVLKGVGEHTQNSVVASICARNTSDPERGDFGYRPALAALIERLETQLPE